MRWTASDRWHVTLAFLGEPDVSAEEDVAQHLQPLQGLRSAAHARLTSALSAYRGPMWDVD